MALGEALLHRVEFAAALQPLHGAHPTAVGHGGEYRARLHRRLVHPDHAGTAVGGVAPPVRAGETEVVPEKVDEQQPRLHVGRVLGVVHGHRDLHVTPPRLRRERPIARQPQRADGELGGQMALVVRGAALVRYRPAVLGGDLPGPDEAFAAGRRAAQEVLGLGRGKVLGADRGQADPGLGDRVTIQPERGAGRAHRPVAGPAVHLHVRAAAAGPDRHPDLGQQLVRRHHGLVRAEVELTLRHGAGARTAVDHHRGPHRGEGGRQVLGRIGLAERAADGAAVAHDRVGDATFGVVQDGEMLACQRGAEQFRVPGERADPQLALLDPQVAELGEVVDVDQRLGLGQAELHHRDQAVPAGQHPGLRPELGQQRERVADAGRALVLKVRGYLHPCPLSAIRPARARWPPPVPILAPAATIR